MITIKKLTNRQQTVQEIERLAESYKNDFNHKLNIVDFFNLIKKIPYKRDKKPNEILKRPKYIMNDNFADCKKKTILAVAYAKKNHIPYRYVTISTRKDRIIHHIFPQFRLKSKWINFDATYDKDGYHIGSPKIYTNYRIYNGGGK